MQPLTVGSTFTGIGGADLGLECAGFRVAWQCELDPWKRSILAAHWPDTPIHEDITTLNDPPPVDVLIGGFPCQDLSVAGKRKGFSGERSVLAFEFLRLAESLRPRWLILENVPGLLSSSRGADFARLINEVVGCGYGVAWRILDARYFGVPQRRRRVFIVARRAESLGDTRDASRLALRALIESGGGDSTPGWPPGSEVAGGVGGGAPSSSGDPIAFYYSGGGNDAPSVNGVSPTVKKGSALDIGSPPAIAYRKARRAQSNTDDETWIDADHANTLNTFDAGDTRTTHAIVAPTAATLTSGGHPNSNAPGRRQEDDTNLVANVVNALDRQAGGPDDNAAQANHLVPDEMTVRRLTPVECERLMGLPDNWTAPEGVKAPDSKRYAACGDAIVTWVAYWIGQRIRMIEEEA